jgi:hypothetical protein
MTNLLLPNYVADPMAFDDWLQSMPSRRRKPLRCANEELMRTGWKSKHKKFSSFIKLEKLPDFDKDQSGLTRLEAMLDRIIQGPSDVSHCIAGPVLKPLIKLLKKRWNYKFPIFYGSTKPEFLHRWLNEVLIPMGGTYFWCDFSMFDNTHSDDSWDFLERMYAKCTTDPLFWKVMEAWRRPQGKIDAFKYQGRVMNASGRDDTALANGILNGFASYLSACAAWLQVDLFSLTPQQVSQCMSEIKLSVTGDDSLGRIPACSAQRRDKFCEDMAGNIARFGFEAKLQASDRLFDAVYLGMRPYPTRQGWFWGKTIGRATYKLGWVDITKPVDPMATMTGIADMHTLCSKHVPILSDLAEKIVELRKGARRTPVQQDPFKPWEWMNSGSVPYDDLTIQAVADIYTTRKSSTTNAAVHDVQVTVDDVNLCIEQIKAITRLPCSLDNAFWRHTVWVDDL